MKKVFLILLLCTTFSVYGQKHMDDVNSVVFYGVDFSKVNIVGADESHDKFIGAFVGINSLFITESEKYNIPKYLGVSVSDFNMEVANQRNSQISRADFYGRKAKTLLESDIKEVIAAYVDPKGESGADAGLLIIAKELNKGSNMGTFVFVVFDLKSAKIISMKTLEGKAKGFGLRNFWANSVQESMKWWKLQSKN